MNAYITKCQEARVGPAGMMTKIDRLVTALDFARPKKTFQQRIPHGRAGHGPAPDDGTINLCDPFCTVSLSLSVRWIGLLKFCLWGAYRATYLWMGEMWGTRRRSVGWWGMKEAYLRLVIALVYAGGYLPACGGAAGFRSRGGLIYMMFSVSFSDSIALVLSPFSDPLKTKPDCLPSSGLVGTRFRSDRSRGQQKRLTSWRKGQSDHMVSLITEVDAE